MNDDTIVLLDYSGLAIRLTAERHEHIMVHSEMVEQFDKIKQTIAEPEFIISTTADDTVHVYHRHYATTPVTSKFLLVAVKLLDNDAFVLTAFFSSRQKKGMLIWTA